MTSLTELKTWLQRSQSSKEKQSNGLAILFEGSETIDGWKTATALAAKTGKVLHHVNLSEVFSKGIGETEMNLQTIFEKAKATDSILFFDEADALFGKRSNVKEAHDRYANTLLQQIEKHNGLVLFATKHTTNLDPAFVRRLNAIVNLSTK